MSDVKTNVRRSIVIMAIACAIAAGGSVPAPARAQAGTGSLTGNVALTLRLFGYTTFSVRVDCLKTGPDAQSLLDGRLRILRSESQHDRLRNDTAPYFALPKGAVETHSDADGSFTCSGLSPGSWFAYVEVDHRYGPASVFESAEAFGRVASGTTTRTGFVRDFFDREMSQYTSESTFGGGRRTVAPLPAADEETIASGTASFSIRSGVRMRRFDDRVLAPKYCVVLAFNAYNWAFVTRERIDLLPLNGYPTEFRKNVRVVESTPQQSCTFSGLGPGTYIAFSTAATTWHALENVTVTREVEGGMVPTLEGGIGFAPDQSIDIPTVQNVLHVELHRRAVIVTISTSNALLSTDVLPVYDLEE